MRKLIIVIPAVLVLVSCASPSAQQGSNQYEGVKLVENAGVLEHSSMNAIERYRWCRDYGSYLGCK